MVRFNNLLLLAGAAFLFSIVASTRHDTKVGENLFTAALSQSTASQREVFENFDPKRSYAEQIAQIESIGQRYGADFSQRRRILLSDAQFENLLAIARKPAPLEIEPGVWYLDASGSPESGIMYHNEARSPSLIHAINTTSENQIAKSQLVQLILDEQNRAGLCRVIGSLNYNYPVTYRYKTQTTSIDVRREVGACG